MTIKAQLAAAGYLNHESRLIFTSFIFPPRILNPRASVPVGCSRGGELYSARDSCMGPGVLKTSKSLGMKILYFHSNNLFFAEQIKQK